MMTMHAGFVLREKLHGSLLPRETAPLFGHLRCGVSLLLLLCSFGNYFRLRLRGALCHFPNLLSLSFLDLFHERICNYSSNQIELIYLFYTHNNYINNDDRSASCTDDWHATPINAICDKHALCQWTRTQSPVCTRTAHTFASAHSLTLTSTHAYWHALAPTYARWHALATTHARTRVRTRAAAAGNTFYRGHAIWDQYL